MTSQRPVGAAAWRTQAYPLAIVAAILIGIAAASVSASGSEAPASELGGDYPAFYGAGKIAAAGDWDHLYEFDRQVEAQAELQPVGEPTARFFAYPPQLALVYQPLSALDYGWSYLVHTLLMGGLLWASILVLRPVIPWLKGRVSLALASALLFWPMFRTVTGGSNTALTVFVIAVVWRLVHDDHPLAAGLVLGVLLYKPQFALPLGGLFLLGRRSRVVAGAVAASVPFYLVGAVLMGAGWPYDWVARASDFGELDAEVNGHSAISFLGFLQNLFGVASTAATGLGWLLAAVTAAGLAWLWWRYGSTRNLAVLMALTMPGILLLSPHTMSHDGALVLLSVAVMVQVEGAAGARPWLVVIWLLGASQLWISDIGFSPGFPMLLLISWWVARRLVSHESIEPSAPRVPAAAAQRRS